MTLDTNLRAEGERCPDCDRVRVPYTEWQRWYDEARKLDGPDPQRDVTRCYGPQSDPNCEPIDWRARALAAEHKASFLDDGKYEALQSQLAAAEAERDCERDKAAANFASCERLRAERDAATRRAEEAEREKTATVEEWRRDRQAHAATARERDEAANAREVAEARLRMQWGDNAPLIARLVEERDAERAAHAATKGRLNVAEAGWDASQNALKLAHEAHEATKRKFDDEQAASRVGYGALAEVGARLRTTSDIVIPAWRGTVDMMRWWMLGWNLAAAGLLTALAAERAAHATTAREYESSVAARDEHIEYWQARAERAEAALATAKLVISAYAIPLEAISIAHWDQLGPDVRNAIANARKAFSDFMAQAALATAPPAPLVGNPALWEGVPDTCADCGEATCRCAAAPSREGEGNDA